MLEDMIASNLAARLNCIAEFVALKLKANSLRYKYTNSTLIEKEDSPSSSSSTNQQNIAVLNNELSEPTVIYIAVVHSPSLQHIAAVPSRIDFAAQMPQIQKPLSFEFRKKAPDV